MPCHERHLLPRPAASSHSFWHEGSRRSKARRSIRPNAPCRRFSPAHHAGRLLRQSGSVKGMNQIGDTGLRDQVNNHYFKIFGASLAVGAIGGISETQSSGLLNQTGIQSMEAGVGESMGQTSQRILDKFLNILPTITIREGHRMKIFLSGDLALPDYANHRLPSDL